LAKLKDMVLRVFSVREKLKQTKAEASSNTKLTKKLIMLFIFSVAAIIVGIVLFLVSLVKVKHWLFMRRFKYIGDGHGSTITRGNDKTAADDKHSSQQEQQQQLYGSSLFDFFKRFYNVPLITMFNNDRKAVRFVIHVTTLLSLTHIHVIHFFFIHCYQAHSNYFVSYLFVYPIFFTADADAAHQLLLHPRIFPKKRQVTSDVVKKLLGHNIVEANGEDWRRMRHLMNPAFLKVEKFCDIFAAKSRICLKNMDKLVVNSSVAADPSYSGVRVSEFMQRMVRGFVGLLWHFCDKFLLFFLIHRP